MKEETEAEVLERVNEQRKQLEVKITVSGVYSLPQEWKDKSVDESQPKFDYEIYALGMAIKGGKLIPRELTDAEKEEAEAAKTKGKAPPPKGKKGQEEEEPSPEEQERLAKEKAEKEELERKRQEEWESLDEETKFFRTKEDIFKEPAIKFQVEVSDRPQTTGGDAPVEGGQPNEAQNENEGELPKTHLEDASVSELKKADELIEVEE